MELTYDWKNFQSLFYGKRRLALPTEAPLGPIYLVLEGTVIISAFAEGEDLSEWIGATEDEMKLEMAHREMIFLKREDVDQWMSASTDLSHFYDQIQFLRESAKSKVTSKGLVKNSSLFAQRHFLLNAIQSWWKKLLPSAYGLYLKIDGVPSHSIFLMIKRDQIESFYMPDLSTMSPDRRKNTADVVKFLSERYLVPVQGIFLTSSEWQEWSEQENPWPKILQAIKSNRNKIYPLNWGLLGLISMRAYFGV